MKNLSVILVAAALAGCATQETRRSWVDPGSIRDAAKYDTDFDECVVIGREAFSKLRSEQRGSALQVLGAGALGVVGGTAVAGAVGGSTLQGGVLGGVLGGETQQGQLMGQLEAQEATMRSCFQSRGYTTIR